MADYTEHYLSGSTPWFVQSPATGCYYNDHAYLFFLHGIQIGQGHARQIACTKARSNGSAIEEIWSNRPVTASQSPFEEVATIAACVHRGVMYVFFTNALGKLARVTSKDGETWSAPVFFDRFTVHGERQIAALSIGERLYVLASCVAAGSDAVLLVWSDDGATWDHEIRAEWVNVGNISVCSYPATAGEVMLLFGMATTNWNVWTGRYLYVSGGAGSRLELVDMMEHTEFRGSSQFVALAAGSARGGNRGQTIQMIVNGWHSGTWAGWKPQRKKEYDVANNRWLEAITFADSYTQYPLWEHFGAFAYIRAVSEKELRQEIWYVFNYRSATAAYLYVARWDSDQLVRIDEATRTEPVTDAFRSLLGVVEGPPPYILNGQPFAPDVSHFHLGYSTTQQVSVSTSFKLGVHFTFGGKVAKTPVIASFQLGAEVTRKNDTSCDYYCTAAARSIRND